MTFGSKLLRADNDDEMEMRPHDSSIEYTSPLKFGREVCFQFFSDNNFGSFTSSSYNFKEPFGIVKDIGKYQRDVQVLNSTISWRIRSKLN